MYVYEDIYIYMYISIYICIYIHTYVYIYIYLFILCPYIYITDEKLSNSSRSPVSNPSKAPAQLHALSYDVSISIFLVLVLSRTSATLRTWIPGQIGSEFKTNQDLTGNEVLA